MDILQNYNVTKFMSYVPKIRKNIGEWWIMEVSLTGKTNHNSSYIAKKLKEYFSAHEGVIFICNNMDILLLAHLGKDINGDALTGKVHDHLPQFSCTCGITDTTADGLLKIQIRLQDLEEERARVGGAGSQLFDMRKNRTQRMVMVIDDDVFMRSLIAKTFRPKASVLEFSDVSSVVDAYLENLPDIVFLDIHLPGGSGIGVLDEILSFDDTAHIVMLSSDSIRDNILSARKYGAKGFVAKPFTQQKLEECYLKCLTTQ